MPTLLRNVFQATSSEEGFVVETRIEDVNILDISKLKIFSMVFNASFIHPFVVYYLTHSVLIKTTFFVTGVHHFMLPSRTALLGS